MEIYFLMDIGWIIVMIALLFVILGGGASAIAGFIADNLPIIIIIGVVLVLLHAVIMWFYTKRIWVVFTSIVYPTQLVFYLVRGVYGLSLIVFTDHPIKFILLAFLYFVYGLGNFVGMCLTIGVTGEFASVDDEHVSIGAGALVVLTNIGLGLLGWFLNIVIFQIGA